MTHVHCTSGKALSEKHVHGKQSCHDLSSTQLIEIVPSLVHQPMPVDIISLPACAFLQIVDVNTTEFRDNSARIGGAIFVSSSTNLNLASVNFLENSADESGGAVGVKVS